MTDQRGAYLVLSDTPLSDTAFQTYVGDLLAKRVRVGIPIYDNLVFSQMKSFPSFAFTGDFMTEHLTFNAGAIVDNQSCSGQNAAADFGPLLKAAGVGRSTPGMGPRASAGRSKYSRRPRRPESRAELGARYPGAPLQETAAARTRSAVSPSFQERRRMRIELSATGFAILALAVSTATPATAAPMMGDASSLAYFTGTWSCKTTKDSNPKMVGQIATLTINANKAWSTVKVPGGTVSVTRDVKLKKIAAVYLGDDGSYSVQQGNWSGSALVLNDVLNSGNDPLGVQTITKESASAFRNNYTAKSAKGPLVVEMECKKK